MPLTPGTTIGQQYRWQKGQSGNPRGRSKLDIDLAQAARAHAPEMLELAVAIARDDGNPPESRLRAIEIVLARGYGRPPQSIALEGRVGHVDLTAAFINAVRAYVPATPPRALPAAE